MDKRYLLPNNDPPSREDYDNLYAQFMGLILSTGKVSAQVPHNVKHPLNPGNKVLVVEKRVDQNWTTYTVTTTE